MEEQAGCSWHRCRVPAAARVCLSSVPGPSAGYRRAWRYWMACEKASAVESQTRRNFEKIQVYFLGKIPYYSCKHLLQEVIDHEF